MESKEKEVLVVWDFWNESKIIQHRDISKYSGAIRGRLRFYSVSELCQAIRNYNDILHSDRHWFTYRWTLDQFLTRKNALDCFVDREIALQKYAKGKPIVFEEDEEDSESADFYRMINSEKPGAQ